jgi:Kef-type K+ transport system membrane component KefB
MPDDLRYVLLLFALFVVPRFLQRYRLPAAITSFLLGGAVAFSGAELLPPGPTLPLLATFGIAAMFLVAGLEVNVAELRRGARVIGEHLALRAAIVTAAATTAALVLDIGVRPAALVALALFTPSTGFILDSLPQLGMRVEEQFWVRAKAIATELLALAILFVTLQSTSAARLALATAALVGMVTILPLLLRLFAASIAPLAPRSEFSFLLMLAVVAAYLTKELGVYYLVGAFLVGASAQFLASGCRHSRRSRWSTRCRRSPRCSPRSTSSTPGCTCTAPTSRRARCSWASAFSWCACRSGCCWCSCTGARRSSSRCAPGCRWRSR